MDSSTFLCKCCLSDSFKYTSHIWRLALSRYIWQNLKKQADLCFSSFLSVLLQPGQTKHAEGNVWFFVLVVVALLVFFGFCFLISRFCANHRIRFGNFLFFSSINSVAKTADSNLCPNSFFNFTVLWLYLAWNWKAISFGKSCHCRLQKEHFHCRSE